MFQRISKMREFAKNLERLKNGRVLIGIPGAAGKHEDSPLNKSELGYIHEKGAPEANIPARPFLVPGVAKIRDEAAKRFKTAGLKTLKGDAKAKEQAFHQVGLIGVNSVRGHISDGIAPPLSPVTIQMRQTRKKNRRSASSTTPLIDTGEMRNSITYAVDKDYKP